MTETERIDEYILQHIDKESDYLHRLWRATQLHLLYGRMASGHLQGRLLKMLVGMVQPKQVLEIGTYSGYSGLCIAEGLEEGAHLHTVEINDEQEDFTNLVIAQVEGYVNVRSEASEESEVVGKLYNESAGDLIEHAMGWTCGGRGGKGCPDRRHPCFQ